VFGYTGMVVDAKYPGCSSLDFLVRVKSSWLVGTANDVLAFSALRCNNKQASYVLNPLHMGSLCFRG